MTQDELAEAMESACAPFKRCLICCASYSFAEWQRLELKGLQFTEDEDGHYLTEHRDCASPGCGGTMALEWRLS